MLLHATVCYARSSIILSFQALSLNLKTFLGASKKKSALFSRLFTEKIWRTKELRNPAC